MLEGRAEVHTEFYDPIVLEAGESVYIDSNMGHAYIAAEGCEEVLLLGVCSSADEQLMESLMTLHGEENPAQQKVARIGAPAANDARPAGRGAVAAKAMRRKSAPAK